MRRTMTHPDILAIEKFGEPFRRHRCVKRAEKLQNENVKYILKGETGLD